jgi:hypothetical protein
MDKSIVQCYAKNVNAHLVTKDGDCKMSAKHQLMEHINNLISWNMRLTKNGYIVNVKEMPQSDLRTFAAYLIDYRNEGLDCITDNKYLKHMQVAIVQALLSNDLHEPLKLRELFLDSICLHYENVMQEMIDEQLEQNINVINWDSGLRPAMYGDNGETYWTARI